jgi:DNA-binding NarL/FixJ family response regulator
MTAVSVTHGWCPKPNCDYSGILRQHDLHLLPVFVASVRSVLATHVRGDRLQLELSLIRPARAMMKRVLTKREGQVLALLLQGKADKEIAAELNLTVRTVRFHISNVFKKKGVARRAELLARELRRKA